MNIKIITRHSPQNYGSLLQCIATLTVLESFGFSPSIIDYQRYDERGFGLTLAQAKKKYGGNWLKILAYIAIRYPMDSISQRRFDKMRMVLLKLTERYSDHEQLKDLTADVFMTGSDQVWGPVVDGKYDSAYFLDFVKSDQKKIAYSASFGKSYFDETVIKDYKKFLSSYEHISVRENIAVELLRQWNCSCDGQTLDPTLLLNSEQWGHYIINDMSIMPKYVLVYGIHSNSRLDNYAKSFADRAGLPLIRVSPFLHQINRGGKFFFCPDLSKFLCLIKNATYVVTDSFHGTAFSINFNVPFIDVLPDTGTCSRNLSLLELTGLEDRILKDENDFSFFNSSINFSLVNSIIERERIKSLDLLKQMILN